LLEDLEVGEFLLELRKEFGGGDEESVKVVELRKIEQGGKMMEEFVQEFRRVARGSGYQESVLVKEFKRRMNEGIKRKLMEVERPPSSIKK